MQSASMVYQVCCRVNCAKPKLKSQPVESRLRTAQPSPVFIYRREDIQAFLDSEASNIVAVLAADPLKARQALRKHITSKLILTPFVDEHGAWFQVTGDITLFSSLSQDDAEEAACSFSLGELMLSASSRCAA